MDTDTTPRAQMLQGLSNDMLVIATRTARGHCSVSIYLDWVRHRVTKIATALDMDPQEALMTEATFVIAARDMAREAARLRFDELKTEIDSAFGGK